MDEEGRGSWEIEKRRVEEERIIMEEEKKRMEEEKKKVEEEKNNLAKERQRMREENEEARRNQVKVSALLLNPPAAFFEGVGASGAVVAPSKKGVPPLPAPGQGRQSRVRKTEVQTIDLPIIAEGNQ